jgi:peptidoglycan/LPS O-acetylase OafA/YrhL
MIASKSRNGGLDIVRVIAVLFVSFGHFTYTAHHRTDISGINNSDIIVANSDWALLVPDQFLSLHFSTYLATIGVSLFFITTGYLMPLMLQRYTRKEFLLNRLFRIFPTLLVSVLMTEGFISWYYGKEFYFTNFIHSIFLTFQFWGVEPIIPVLWTLVIEMFFYFLCFLLGNFSSQKLIYAMGAVFVLSMGIHFWHLGVMEYMLKYLLIIFTGSALYFLHNQVGDRRKNFAVLAIALLLWFGVFVFTEPDSPYSHLSTLIFTTGIMSFFLFYPPKPIAFITLLADIVYPLYLLHFTFGLTTMLFVKTFLSTNAYVMITLAYGSVVLISLLVHYGVEKPFYFYIKQRLRR